MFKIIDRKEKEYIVLIPGWAFDYRIFNMLDLKYNYLLFCGKSGFEKELKQVLEENKIEKISLFGWSQGAFLAYSFACMNEDIINELILVSIKKKYDRHVLEDIKKYLKKNKNAYLNKFYTQCFCKEEQNYSSWFKKNFLNDYLDTMNTEDLIEGLDFISQAEIKPGFLKKIRKIKIIHGQQDKIAPINEIMDIKNILPQAEFIVFNNSGHLPFLKWTAGAI